MSKIKPKKLKKQDKVLFICPSSGISKDNERLNKSVEYLNSLGLEVILGDSCFERNDWNDHDDVIKVKDLHSAFQRDDIQAVFASLGGYGASRIVDKIDYEIIKNNPKLFMGFSDITVLLNAFNQKANLVTCHGLVGTFMSHPNIDEFSLGNFEEFLFDDLKDKIFTNLDSDSIIIGNGQVKGELVGGNLALITALEGTPYSVDFKDKIVFIEEVNESPYRIDRMLSTLRLSGKLQEAKGFLLGTFTNSKGGVNYPFEVIKIIKNYFSDLGKPVIYNFNSGHSFPFINLPIGLDILLDADNNYIQILDNFYKGE